MKYLRLITLKRLPWLVLVAALVICLAMIPGSNKPADNFIARDLIITPSEASIGEQILVEFWIDINTARLAPTPSS